MINYAGIITCIYANNVFPHVLHCHVRTDVVMTVGHLLL